MSLPPLPDDIDPYFARFGEAQMLDYAYAVRAATIEECAKVCESQSNDWASSSAWESSHAARDCAAAIRALKAG